MTRNRLLAVVGIVISAVALWFAFRGLRPAELLVTFRRANYLFVIPAACLILADYWFRALRWRVILAPIKRNPVERLFPTLIIGFAANNVIPARVGELWRVWGLDHQEQVGKSRALATLVLERVFDGFTLLFLLALYSLWFPLSGQARLLEYLFLLFFGAVLAGLLLLLFLEAFTLRLATFLMWPLPGRLRERALAVIGNFALGLHSLRNPRTLGAIVGTSLLAWLCEAGGYYALMQGFGLPLSPTHMAGAAILTLCLINLGILLPAAPGYVGTFESFGKLALVGGFAVREELALGVVVLSHGLQYLLVTGLGFFFAARAGLNLLSSQPVQSLSAEDALVPLD
ncbi:MAG TPA: lysylphosphatidylglycerol synthase transmembrane domain-containing protein [Ardenticatenaceae bacterium]|nr:lysylphosphatidylglycerol synthase transmembrane domain-containing protein [Ardenticatenaceae bacterium]